MKYWTQLNELDEAVYKVQAVNSGLQILSRTDEMTSADSGLPEEFQTFLADLNDRMDEAVKNLKEKFQDVWDVVREDTFEENMEAIDDLEREQADKVRFQKIVDSIKPIETDTITLTELAAESVYIPDDNMNDQHFVWTIKEEDGNIVTSHQPTTPEDKFDEEWEFAQRQSNR